MKAKALLFFVSIACVPTVCAFGQIDCSTSTKLVCQLPITPLDYSVAGQEAEKAAKTKLNPINASFATQLTQLPVPSAAIGVVNLRDKGSDSIGTPYDNLGPILTDRPDTVGKGYLFGGFSYQRFNFNKVDGVKLGSVPVGYSFKPVATSGDQQTIYGGFNNAISFKLNQYVALLTYGATPTTDVTVIIPFNEVSLDVVASNFQAYIYDSVLNQYSNESYPKGTTVKTAGSASGIGDVTVSVKQMIHGAEGTRAAISVGAAARIPTGDKLNYLGSGTWGANIYGLFSYRKRITPHLKLSYQWNGVSDLINPTATPNGSKSLPGGLQYDAGADWRVRHSLTVAADILGNQFANTPSLIDGPVTLDPKPTAAQTFVPLTLPGVAEANNTYTTANVSAGLKWSPHAGLLLYGNVLLPINNVGLHSDPVPLFGIAYNLKVGRR